jgi:hypothetical protein
VIIIPKHTLTNDSITVVHQGKVYTTQRGTANFVNLRKAILEERWEDLVNHLTIPKSVSTWAKGKFTYVNEKFLFEGKELPNDFHSRIIKMASGGEDPTPLFAFWEKLQKNPSFRSVNQLWAFLQQKGIPLTKDGCFLAYKSVKMDFKDHHSGKFSNKPGSVLEMPRNQISDDPNHACHEGFHVGALEYAQGFGSSDRRIVICRIDPADVVCVPYDSSQQKMRVCKYVVEGLHNGSHMSDTVHEDEDIDVDVDDFEEGEDESADQEAEGDALFNDGVSGSSPEEKTKKLKKNLVSLDKMDLTDLMEQSLDVLRKYAARDLKIIGASKIPGGKLALVKRIMKDRP